MPHTSDFSHSFTEPCGGRHALTIPQMRKTSTSGGVGPLLHSAVSHLGDSVPSSTSGSLPTSSSTCEFLKASRMTSLRFFFMSQGLIRESGNENPFSRSMSDTTSSLLGLVTESKHQLAGWLNSLGASPSSDLFQRCGCVVFVFKLFKC